MSSAKKFPSGKYGKQNLDFYAAPARAPLRAFAALMFAWKEEKVLICDIVRRGWCIPSGQVEPNETSLEAAIRETQEEGGVQVSDCQYIGCYRIRGRNDERWVDAFAGNVIGQGAILSTEESLGMQFVDPEELPRLYHIWNPLMKQVFEHSKAVLLRAEALDH